MHARWILLIATAALILDSASSVAAPGTPADSATRAFRAWQTTAHGSECSLAQPPLTADAEAPLAAATRLVPADAVEPPQAFETLPWRTDLDLEKRLLPLIGSDAASYAFVVKDLTTGRGVSFHAGQVFYAASLFKLFVMFEVFHQESLGLLHQNDQLIMTPYYDSFGLESRRTVLCQTLTVSEALHAMMSASDNASAVLLQDLVGAENINRSMSALGLTDSLLAEELPVTAADLGLLLEAIGRKLLVSPAASEEMIGLMTEEELDNGLAAGLPRDVVVAHKTGNWPNATHDAGLVFVEGRAYFIVVLSDKDHETTLIKAISAAVYDHYALGN